MGGLALFLYLGSPQSRESDQRKEEKLDAILRQLNRADADGIISRLEKRYPKR